MKRNNLYLPTPCLQPKCVYPCYTCVGCEFAIDDISIMFNPTNILFYD